MKKSNTFMISKLIILLLVVVDIAIDHPFSIHSFVYPTTTTTVYYHPDNKKKVHLQQFRRQLPNSRQSNNSYSARFSTNNNRIPYNHDAKSKNQQSILPNLQSPATTTTTRTNFLHTTTSIIGAITGYNLPYSNSRAAIAVDNLDTNELPNGLLESRVMENVLSPVPYGMESTDIFYPSYFQGVWDVKSITSSIEAPCGIPLFGGNRTYNQAQTEIGPEHALYYSSRFIPSSSSSSSSSNINTYTNSTTIADRDYNVQSIAQAAMGSNAVLDVPIVTPNKVSCILSPSGADGIIFQADLLVLARRQEYINKDEFHCSEVVRQIVAPLPSSSDNKRQDPINGMGKAALLKEVETTSLYFVVRPKNTNDNDDGSKESINEIRCLQRSATYLLPSQQDRIALRMWEMSKGRPIDVRFYDIIYTRRK